MPPAAAVMQMVMGAWVSQTISSVTRLNIPDLLHGHGPLTAAQLTRDHGVPAHTGHLERALRACAAVGLFTEDAAGRFGPTELSEVLTLGSSVSVKKFAEMYGASWWRVWGGLGDAIRTGEPQAKAALGMEYWDYCQANPKEMEDFGEAMKSNSRRSLQGILDLCDLEGVGTAADIGGGFGHVMIALLRKYPGMRGIVMELPDLASMGRKRADNEDADVADRIEFVGGDMFEAVPAAEVYILKHICHDWDDEHCVQVLGNCRKSLDGEGRVMCVDTVLPEMGDTSRTPAKFLDLNMMVFHPGKERTRTQWKALYDAAGLRISSVRSIDDNFGLSIIEGVKSRSR